MWFVWSASEVEDGAWLLFTWGQGREGWVMDESVVFVICVGYKRLVNFLPVWQRAASGDQLYRTPSARSAASVHSRK